MLKRRWRYDIPAQQLYLFLGAKRVRRMHMIYNYLDPVGRPRAIRRRRYDIPAQGCEERATLGIRRTSGNPERVESKRSLSQPRVFLGRAVDATPSELLLCFYNTQGSSFLATLGWNIITPSAFGPSYNDRTQAILYLPFGGRASLEDNAQRKYSCWNGMGNAVGVLGDHNPGIRRIRERGRARAICDQRREWTIRTSTVGMGHNLSDRWWDRKHSARDKSNGRPLKTPPCFGCAHLRRT
jgi:hypothetical protein